MLRIAICDDDERMLQQNSLYVERFLKKEKYMADVHTYQSGQFLLFDIEENVYYDLILLDIEMPKMNGMQIAKKIKELSPDTLIIFITSHYQYAIDSFELSIFRYIPKDSVKARLPQALKDIISYIDLQKDNTYTICTPTRYEKISLKNIIYIKKDGKYSLFMTPDGEVQIRKTLNKVYEEIDSDNFIYIDRGCIVNIYHIMKFEDSEIIMKNGVFLPVSKKRYRELKATVSKYWGEKI